jgi:hypothetical protein
VKTQTTFATLVPSSGGGYSCRVLHQDVLVGGTVYTVQELYGIAGEVKASRIPPVVTKGDEGSIINVTTSAAGQGYAIEKGHECVICLTESCTTAVVPCNHLCLCDDCGEKLCSDSNFERRRCPICRSPLTSLLRIIGNRSTRLEAEGAGLGQVSVNPSGRSVHARDAAVGEASNGSLVAQQGVSSASAVVEKRIAAEGRELASVLREEAASLLSLSYGVEHRDEGFVPQRQSADGIVASLEQDPGHPSVVTSERV